jgi:flagellar biosynthesis/type III secretory pathway M-ring protein FliF/YscJ
MEADRVESLRKVISTIGTYLRRMTPTQRLLVMSMGVIVALSLGLVALWTGRSGMVELLPGSGGSDLQRAGEALRSAGVRHEVRQGRLLVPPHERDRALAAVSEAGKLPTDSAQLFRNILERQTWHTSRQQSEQLYLVDLQTLLARVISKFRGIESANVVLHLPTASNLGSATPKPTASVTVWTTSGQALPQATVDAIAAVVAGAHAGLDRSRIRVVDGSTGRERRPTNEGDVIPGTYLEQAGKVEQQTREKLLDLLAHIPGVRIAVTAQVDVTRVSAQVQKHFEVGEGTLNLVKRETGMRTSTQSASSAAEPGVRSNVGLDVNMGSGAGARTEQSETTEEFDGHVGKRVENIIDPRGMATMLVASIAVPRGYIVSLLKRQGGGDGEPTDADIDQAFAREQARIVEAVRPHLKSRTAEGAVVEGEVAVSLIPVDMAPGAGPGGATGLLGAMAGGGGLGGAVVGMLDKLILGALALVAFVMMLMLVRRGSRPEALPEAEELAGVPPTLETRSDLIGEADESETPMAGIEVDEQEVQSQKILDQVGELVNKDPEMAAKLITRWVSHES